MLSVVLATHNESANIKRCLQSVTGLADEIVVVDGSSTDDTRDIAASFGARVVKTTNTQNFHINKQKALDLARGEWILQLDADEEVSPLLSREIHSVIDMDESALRSRRFNPAKAELFARHQKLLEIRDGKFSREDQSTAAFFLPRLNLFLGKPLRHAGVYPDGVIRLVKKGRAHFPCKSVHEQIQVAGHVDWLENDLLHHDSPTFAKYLSRANRYTDLTALEYQRQRLKINLISHLKFLVIKPLTAFFSLYLRHKGFLDGFPGFVWCLFSALHHPIAYLKYWELEKVTSKKVTSYRQVHC